ncbi:hypothetical protein DKX38_014616 [Salix brachista]|uniref:Uncharacterized protein n=1 Tax=Salix brachista TaxID=2182728 RepID=A0A5N5LG78_9ROSI|nr:hypothetical protein DKX38_014616 [Salix brachista]
MVGGACAGGWTCRVLCISLVFAGLAGRQVEPILGLVSGIHVCRMVTAPIKLEPQTRYARMGQEAILVPSTFSWTSRNLFACLVREGNEKGPGFGAREGAALESLSLETGNSKPAKIGSYSSGDRDNHLHVKVMETRHSTRNLRYGSVWQYHMKLRVKTHEKVCKCYTLGKPERRSGKRGVYGAKVNYRLEGEEGRRFSHMPMRTTS